MTHIIEGVINLAQFLLPAWLIAWADRPRPAQRSGGN